MTGPSSLAVQGNGWREQRLGTPGLGAARRSGTPRVSQGTAAPPSSPCLLRPPHPWVGSTVRGSGRPRGSAIRFAIPSVAPRQAASPPSTGRPLHSPRSPCLLPLPSRPSPVSCVPRASSGSPAAAPRRPAAFGPSRGRSASSPRVPPSSPAARRALTGWPVGCRRLSSSAPRASGGVGAASRVGPPPWSGTWPGRGLRRSGCPRRVGRALGGWRRPPLRRPASRASAPGRGLRWRSRSAWVFPLSSGSRRASRRPRAGAWASCAPGGRAPGGAREGAFTGGREWESEAGAVWPGRRGRRPVHTPPRP